MLGLHIKCVNECKNINAALTTAGPFAFPTRIAGKKVCSPNSMPSFGSYKNWSKNANQAQVKAQKSITEQNCRDSNV